jgi:hypothetical protein
MKVKILRSTIADKKTLRKGEVYELPDKVAKYLIILGKAIEVKNARSNRKTDK